MSNYKYCTKNINTPTYKIFTCPGTRCPNGDPKIVEITEMDKEEKITVNWNAFQNAYHCKVHIKAKKGLNGKIVMDIIKNDDTHSYIYMQPNDFNPAATGTHGILENNC